MTISLLDEIWISVRDRDGAISKIAPWQIAEGNGLRYTTLAAPRPDFNGALAQFLIGLLQTAFAPEDDKAWRKLWDAPPTPEQLRQAFDQYREAFVLDGDGPRFMQHKLAAEANEPKKIGFLLLDAFGDNTLKFNRDHFYKRASFRQLCSHCVATALYTLQLNAPGNKVYRSSIRRGGPLTTLLLPKNDNEGITLGLWHRLWLNVLPADVMLNESSQTDGKAIFSWLSQKSFGELITPQMVHPYFVYWAMPRQLAFDFEHTFSGRCDLCGEDGVELHDSYKVLDYGPKTEGFQHPLSPYQRKNANEFALPIPTPRGGVGYRDWAGVVVSGEDGSGKGFRAPSKIVGHHRLSFYRRDIDSSIWAFGFGMKDMNARAWFESRMPLLLVSRERQEDFENRANLYVLAACRIERSLLLLLRKAIYCNPDRQKGGGSKWLVPEGIPDMKDFPRLSLVENCLGDYWRNGEPVFYEHLEKLRQAVEDEKDLDGEPWRKALCKLAVESFNRAVESFEVSDSRIKAVIAARRELWFEADSNEVRGLLRLPQREQKMEKLGKGKKRGR